MRERSIQIQETQHCGIDVSVERLTMVIQRVGQPIEQTSFPKIQMDGGPLVVWPRRAQYRVATFSPCEYDVWPYSRMAGL